MEKVILQISHPHHLEQLPNHGLHSLSLKIVKAKVIYNSHFLTNLSSYTYQWPPQLGPKIVMEKVILQISHPHHLEQLPNHGLHSLSLR
jgi:hypothetical protein